MTTPPPPIYVIDTTTDIKTQVPSKIVKYCESFTSLDAYKQNNGYDNLRLYDCYLYNMGHYGFTPANHTQDHQREKKSSESERTNDFGRSMDDDGGDRTSHTFVF